MKRKTFGKRNTKSSPTDAEKAKASDWLGLGLLAGIIGSMFTMDYWMPAADGFIGFICKVIDFSELDPEIWALRPSYSYADSLSSQSVNGTAIALILAIAIVATVILCVVGHYKTSRQIKRTLSASRRSALGLT